jgi:DNA polymerase-3 subunit chi
VKVEFHTGLADKIGAACRFLGKAHAAGASVVVCGDRASLDRLDTALWTFEPLSFVAHLRVSDATSGPALSRTPIWLVEDGPAALPARQLLVNIGQAMVESWHTFERVVELVSMQAEDVNAGRLRWRQYAACPGITLEHPTRTAG